MYIFSVNHADVKHLDSCEYYYNSGDSGRITVPTGKVVVFYTNRKIGSEVYHGPVVYYDPIFSEPQLVDVQSQRYIRPFQCVAQDDQVVTFPRIDVTNQLSERHVNVLSKFEKFYDNPPVPYDKTLIYDEAISFIKELCTQMTGEELRKEKYDTLNEVLLDHLTEFQKNRPELAGNNTGIEIRRGVYRNSTLDPKVELIDGNRNPKNCKNGGRI